MMILFGNTGVAVIIKVMSRKVTPWKEKNSHEICWHTGSLGTHNWSYIYMHSMICTSPKPPHSKLLEYCHPTFFFLNPCFLLTAGNFDHSNYWYPNRTHIFIMTSPYPPFSNKALFVFAAANFDQGWAISLLFRSFSFPFFSSSLCMQSLEPSFVANPVSGGCWTPTISILLERMS